jgi:hypothetical protein
MTAAARAWTTPVKSSRASGVRIAAYQGAMALPQKGNSGLQCRPANIKNALACTPIPRRPQRARSGPYLKAEAPKRPNRLGVLLWAKAERAFGRPRALST